MSVGVNLERIGGIGSGAMMISQVKPRPATARKGVKVFGVQLPNRWGHNPHQTSRKEIPGHTDRDLLQDELPMIHHG